MQKESGVVMVVVMVVVVMVVVVMVVVVMVVVVMVEIIVVVAMIVVVIVMVVTAVMAVIGVVVGVFKYHLVTSIKRLNGKKVKQETVGVLQLEFVKLKLLPLVLHATPLMLYQMTPDQM